MTSKRPPQTSLSARCDKICHTAARSPVQPQFRFFPAFCGKSLRFELLTEGSSRQNLSSDERFVAFQLRLCYTFAHNKVSSSQPRCPELAEKKETLLPSFTSGREKTIKPTSPIGKGAALPSLLPRLFLKRRNAPQLP